MARAAKKDEEQAPRKAARKRESGTAMVQCLCGAVSIEVGTPVFWAWHDHSRASRIAHGAAYATHVGTYRSKVRIAKGQESIARFVEPDTGNARSFCSRCGAPLIYERKRSPKWVNLPRSLFSSRTGREPRYHIAFDELQDWIYTGASLAPLKGYPGVMWERPKSKRARSAPVFEPDF
jgi:hypothetical protein